MFHSRYRREWVHRNECDYHAHVDVFEPESSSLVTGCPALPIGYVTALGGSSYFVLFVDDTDGVLLRVTVGLRVNGKVEGIPDLDRV